jgi:hypothetical protein
MHRASSATVVLINVIKTPFSVPLVVTVKIVLGRLFIRQVIFPAKGFAQLRLGLNRSCFAFIIAGSYSVDQPTTWDGILKTNKGIALKYSFAYSTSSYMSSYMRNLLSLCHAEVRHDAFARFRD